MDNGIITAYLTVIGTLLGTVLGWVLNYLQDKINKKTRMCFSLQTGNVNEEIDEKDLESKYYKSDYCIQIYNIGQKPYLLDNLSLQYRRNTITDCTIDKDIKLIMPYRSLSYQLNKQDYDNIVYHCKKENLKKCKVVAYDINGKKTKGFLDLYLLSTRI